MLPEGEDGAGGYREHDILVVTDGGATNITKFPLGPEHNIIPFALCSLPLAHVFNLWPSTCQDFKSVGVSFVAQHQNKNAMQLIDY